MIYYCFRYLILFCVLMSLLFHGSCQKSNISTLLGDWQVDVQKMQQVLQDKSSDAMNAQLSIEPFRDWIISISPGHIFLKMSILAENDIKNADYKILKEEGNKITLTLGNQPGDLITFQIINQHSIILLGDTGDNFHLYLKRK